MQRSAVLLVLLLAPVALAAPEGDSFGAPGTASFVAYTLPGDASAGEPSIGIPWDTDHVFVQAFTDTYRGVFPENGTGEPEWTDVTPPFSQINLDPLLVVDSPTGRIFAGGLNGPCSVMGISDDNGENWVPAGNMCSGVRFDHQSLGAGAWAASPVPRGALGRATYYCAQLDTVACATSIDGGRTWLPWMDVMGGCTGFHGHIKVSEASGQAVLPFADCADEVGFGTTTDNGVTWTSVTIPGSRMGKGIGFDPAAAFTTSGWLYYSHANDLGIYVGLSKDGGASWETLGARTPGVSAGAWLNLSAAYTDPQGRPLRYANFVNVVAGDDDRAALTFLATADEGTKPWVCTDASDGLVWHYYVAQTFDAGQEWTVMRVSDDPVQVGGMYDGSEGSGECRNLLDFNDATTDSKGRIHIAFADGCTGECAKTYLAGGKPSASSSRDDVGTVFRQVAGRGVFAAFDGPAPPVTETTPPPTPEDQKAPGPEMLLVVAAVAVALVARRRK